MHMNNYINVDVDVDKKVNVDIGTVIAIDINI